MSDLIVSAGTPAKTAKLFKAARRPNLVNQQGEWLDWNGAAYQPIEAATIRAEVSAYLETAKTMKSVDGRKMKAFPFDPEPKHIVAVVTMLETLCHAPKDTMAPPCWLPGTPNELLALDPVSLISCQNGLLDPATRTLYDATPFFFTRNALSLEFDELAPAPTQWLEFLNETLQGRAPLIELVQEMMGYVISSDTSMQKVFFMFGRPRSGKGTILRVTTALVGAGNTTFPTIETLGGQYGLQGLIGKSLAQITDMNTDSREKLGVAASRINGISGEDGQTIERKYMTPYDGKLGTRFVMAGNTMPNLGSHTLAMAPRLLIVPFEVSFAGREDRELTDKLMLELAGILNWALAGLDSLRARGDFLEPAESVTAKIRLIHKSDPIHGFVAERCAVTGDPDSGTDKAILYRAFTDYCSETGSRAVPLKDFTAKLEELFPGVGNSRRRTGSGDHQQPCYRGIEFNEEAAARLYRNEIPEPAALKIMAELGCSVWAYIDCDAGGWPIPTDRRDFEV